MFLRVFLGFWLVTLVVLASWSVFTAWLDTRPQWQDARDGGPPRFLLRTVYQLQNAPRQDLPGIADELRRRHGIELYLLERGGKDLIGRELPAELKIRASQPPRGPHRRPGLVLADGRRMASHQLYRPDTGPVRALFVFPAPDHGLLQLLDDHRWLRLALTLVVSGLCCYLLSLLLTRRLHALQRAARQLAAGDLSARIAVSPRGGDETASLARDFNAMADQLQQRDAARERLLRDISHELRSPLARLRVALELARESGGHSPQLDRMEQEAERLEALIQQLLSSRGEQPALDRELDLVPLLAQLCEDASFEGSGEGKVAELVTSLAAAPVASHGDLLLRCFENILRNALRHTAEDSRVVVALDRDGSEYRVGITDRGPGLPESELTRVFDAFYRIDEARSRDSGGHGLGLAIARRAATSHGGRIAAANTGTGLAVTVWLPALP